MDQFEASSGQRDVAAAFYYVARLTVYGLVTVLVCRMVFHLVEDWGPGVIGREDGPIESAQVLLAISAAICLFTSALRCRPGQGRSVMMVAAAMVAFAAARECDALSDAWLFEGAYKYLAGIPLGLASLWALIRDRKTVLADVARVMSEPSVTMFVIAGLLLCTVGQTLERPALWQAETMNLATNPATLGVVRLVEEFFELWTYLLIAFAAVESIFYARRTVLATTQVAIQDLESPSSRRPTLRRATRPVTSPAFRGRGRGLSRGRGSSVSGR